MFTKDHPGSSRGLRGLLRPFLVVLSFLFLPLAGVVSTATPAMAWGFCDATSATHTISGLKVHTVFEWQNCGGVYSVTQEVNQHTCRSSTGTDTLYTTPVFYTDELDRASTGSMSMNTAQDLCTSTQTLVSVKVRVNLNSWYGADTEPYRDIVAAPSGSPSAGTGTPVDMTETNGLLGSVLGILQAILNAILTLTSDLALWLVDLGTDIIEGFNGVWSNYWSAMEPIFAGFVDGIADLTANLMNVFSEGGSFVTAIAATIAEWSVGFMADLLSGLREVATFMVGLIGDMVGGIDWAVDLGMDAMNTSLGLLRDLALEVVEQVGNLLGLIQDLWDLSTDILNTLVALPGLIVDALRSATEWMGAFVQSMFVPSEDFFMDQYGQTWDVFMESTPGQYIAEVDQLAPSGASTGCAGPRVDVDTQYLKYHGNPLSACGNLADAAGMVRLALSVAIGLWGALVCVRVVSSGLGWRPGVGEAAS